MNRNIWEVLPVNNAQIWLHLLKKSLMVNFIVCAVEPRAPLQKLEKTQKNWLCSLIISCHDTSVEPKLQDLVSIRLIKIGEYRLKYFEKINSLQPGIALL